MNTLIVQLFAVFAPIVGDIIKRYQETHDGKFPTGEEITAEFHSNIEKGLGVGVAWKKSKGKS